MTNKNLISAALCVLSLTTVGTMGALLKERREFNVELSKQNDILQKQNEAIRLLSEQVRDIGFCSKSTENGAIYLVKR
jgi:hypothetical protein